MKYKLIEHNTDAQMNWDSNDDTRAFLTVGAVYEAEVEVHKWHTKLLIGGKKYNAVCFDEVTFGCELETPTKKEQENEPTDICPICMEEKPVSDLHRNCGK